MKKIVIFVSLILIAARTADDAPITNRTLPEILNATPEQKHLLIAAFSHLDQCDPVLSAYARSTIKSIVVVQDLDAPANGDWKDSRNLVTIPALRYFHTVNLWYLPGLLLHESYHIANRSRDEDASLAFGTLANQCAPFPSP